MKKISTTDIKKLLITGTATVVIVLCGIAIPALILNGKAQDKALPRGTVNIDDVQPYGADIIQKQTDLMNAIIAYDRFVGSSDYFDPDNITPVRVATLSNNYSEIGVAGNGTTESDEFLYALNQEIGEYFPEGGLPESFNVYQWDENYIVLYYDFDNYLVIDGRSGVPLAGYVRFYSSDYNSLSAATYAIAQLYTRYTGLAFVDDMGVDWAEDEGQWDHYYSHTINTSDGLFYLNLTFDSGWYWTEPAYQGDSWHSTELYQWDIYFYLDRT